MESYGVLSILPPLLALGMAIKTKQVYVSLLLGIWLGWTILNGWNPLIGLIVSVNEIVGVFGDRDRTLTILLTAMIGALIAFTQYSGGMEGFIERVSAGGLVNNRRSASVLAWLIGFVIFVEANVGVFVVTPGQDFLILLRLACSISPASGVLSLNHLSYILFFTAMLEFFMSMR